MIKRINVTLRKRKYDTGRISLYLDFYPPIVNFETGKPTRREYLSLFIIDKPRSAEEKQKNKSTLRHAERLRDKRIEELRKPEVYNHFEQQILKRKKLGEKNVVKYLKEIASKSKSKSDRAIWRIVIKYFASYSIKNEQKKIIKASAFTFSYLNLRLLKDYKDYLLKVPSIGNPKKKLSQNTAAAYFNKIRFGLKEAFSDELLESDIGRQVKSIRILETRRKHLTENEIELLINTSCKSDLLRRAAFFSILTGVRKCDIKKMTWSEIEYKDKRGYCLNFDQQKTKGVEVLPINEQAYKLLGNPKEAEKRVFEGLKSDTTLNKYLKDWLAESGIKKHITFHCFRHTHAILHVINRTDWFTLSGMLGHKSIKTTQIYARAVNSMKIEASKKLIIKKL